MDLAKAADWLENKAAQLEGCAKACDQQRTASRNYDDLKLEHLRKAAVCEILAGAIRAGLT